MEGRCKMSSDWRWGVAVTTAPRPRSTLEYTLASLREAGFVNPLIVRDETRAGPFPTWLSAIRQLIEACPSATAYLTVQDDVLFCEHLRTYLERSLWPSENTALCSPFCPGAYRREETGWHQENHGWGLVGAQCWAIPAEICRRMLRELSSIDSFKRLDAIVGRWALEEGLDCWYHTPSLAQHIGLANSALGDNLVTDLREAYDFVGEGNKPMKLAALCCTYKRPHLLGHLIESFLRQDYPQELRELVILDDAGQYDHQVGDGWRLISVPNRFHTLGEKRNACAALASADVEGFLIADDDDIYLPHWFTTQAMALKRAEWSRPSLVLLEHGKGLKEFTTNGLYQGGWAYRKETFYRVGGYRAVNNGEDQELAHRLNQAKVTQCDPLSLGPSFYIYRVETDSYHVSFLKEADYQKLEAKKADRATIDPHWPREYQELSIIRRHSFAPHVNPRDDRPPVELIREVNGSGRDGPVNGMYALQKGLRKRIAEGLDWLSIKQLPASEGALAWFWHWEDRRYANWWDSEGQPFVQGPNLLFTFSGKPRIDAEECALLDAKNCRAMFCHSPWYRDLIARHRGPFNTSPIILWPYPVNPWPEGPLPDEYDLLIFAKNGHRPQLLEHLAEKFPRHIQIHYGQFERAELFEAARRSKVCAYLADDDHGPLAQMEILLAGCPAVGVRTGAPMLEDGVTGYWVDRLPPGQACVTSEAEQECLNQFMETIARAQELNRHDVRNFAVERFDTERTIDRVVAALENARMANIHSNHQLMAQHS